MSIQAELILLARELRIDPDDLSFLREASGADVRRLRHRMATALDRQHRRLFRGMAKASHIVPKKIAARIGMSTFGPVFCGRMATELSPEHAAGFLEHVTTSFMADCCPHIRPDRLGPLADAMPDDVITPVLDLLLERGEHVTIAQFAGFVSPRLLARSTALMPPADLVEVISAAPDPDTFGPVVEGLSDASRAELAEAAADSGAPGHVISVLESRNG